MIPTDPPPRLEPLLSADQIATRVRELGEEISAAYDGSELIVLCVLQGATVFFADLVRALPPSVRCAFLQASSYGSGTESSGEVAVTREIEIDLRGRHVLIVEDIVDTGRTAKAILEAVMAREAASISICTLLDKKERREVDVAVRWVGFEIPDRFVVGYGLDLDGRYRGLPGVWVVPE